MSRQLTECQRFVLAEWLRLNRPKREIAQRLHVDRSTVYREPNRNTGPIGYLPEEAQGRAQTVRQASEHKLESLPTHLRHTLTFDNR